jgi:hypothetical protein
MPWEIEQNFAVGFGNNTFVNTPHLIVYRGISIFTIERNSDSGYLGVSFKIYDDTGKKLATIGQNRVFTNKNYKGEKFIAIEGSPHDFIVREKPSGREVCNIKRKEKAGADVDLELTVSLYMPDGCLLEITPYGINLPGNIMFQHCVFDGGGGGGGLALTCPGEPQPPIPCHIGISVPAEFCGKPFSYK